MARRQKNDLVPCPFLDLDDPRCARHFSLGRMEEAFDTCFGRHQCCATYYRIQAEQRAHIRLTLFGEPIDPGSTETEHDVPGRRVAEHAFGRANASDIGAGLRATGT